MNEAVKIVRVETDEQIAKTVRLAHEIWTEYYTPLIGKNQVEYMLENFQNEQSIKRQLSEGYLYFLAVLNSEAGYCSVKFIEAEKKLFLSKLYVAGEYRKNGVAKKLLKHSIELFGDRIDTVYLTVNKHNDGSIEAYKHMGFEITESIVTDIGSGFVMDDYVMELKIS